MNLTTAPQGALIRTLLASCLLVGFICLAWLRAWSGLADISAFWGVAAALFLLYGLSCWTLKRSPSPSARWILFWALLFRLAVLPAGLTGGGMEAPSDWLADLRGEVPADSFLLYDNDVWRYLWDGRLSTSGLDVYRYAPSEIEALAESGQAEFEQLTEPNGWDEIFSRVSYREYRTVYPPLAQLLFAAAAWIAPGSVLFWKLITMSFDLLTCYLLIRLLARLERPVGWAMIYAWNPLVIKELTASAHVDAALICFLMLCGWELLQNRHKRAWTAFAAAILVKPTPVLLAPLLLRRTPRSTWWILPLWGCVAFLPFWRSWSIYADSLAAFARDWAFNAGPWNLFLAASRFLGFADRGFADTVSLGLTLILIAGVVWWDDGTYDGWIRGSIGILGGYLVLSPTVMPWYLLWVLPWVALRPSWTWPVFTGAALLSYGIYIDGTERAWLLTLEFSLVAVAALWDLRSVHRRRTGIKTGEGP